MMECVCLEKGKVPFGSRNNRRLQEIAESFRVTRWVFGLHKEVSYVSSQDCTEAQGLVREQLIGWPISLLAKRVNETGRAGNINQDQISGPFVVQGNNKEV